MKASQFREMTPQQLRDELTKLKKELFNLRFRQASSQLENTARFSQARRDVARIKTTLNAQARASAHTPETHPTTHDAEIGSSPS